MGEPDGEVARSMYRILVQSLETHYGEIIRFVAILIPSLTGYGVILYQYALAGASKSALPLVIVTIIVVIMQVWGAWSALAMSYRFRYLQLAVSKIERHFRVDTLLPKRFQASLIESHRDRISLRIAPEILRVHVMIFMLVVVAVSVGSSVMLHEAVYTAVLLVLGVGAIARIMYAGAIVYPNKYNGLFEDIEREESSSDVNAAQTM